jgi:hypothetical protein
MTAPTAAASLDKTAPAPYAPGDPMRLSITYGDVDSKAATTKTGAVTLVVADAEGNASAPVQVPYVITVPGVDVPGSFRITVTDPDRTWSVVDGKNGTASATSTAT